MSQIVQYFIKEKPIIQECTILKESKSGRVRCKAIFQALNIPGKNKRQYPSHLVESELQRKTPDMKQRTFLGELDHPITDDAVRNTTVLYKESSHVIVDAYLEDSNVVGIFEPLQGPPNGKTLYGLIVYDKIPIGFSLRALGGVKTVNNIYEVSSLTMITYDAVTNPSFTDARLLEVNMQEAFQIARNMVNNTSQSLLEQQQPVVCFKDKCYLVEHLDRVLGENIARAVNSLLWGA